ncbi:unnamed protein product [Lactuca saligna]|uniref:Uncharacterized protein n=1 Tax=Lactuca saligna TaxID=75948 RepID=A0AA35VPH5_LACSI|nr:unnamed protein product [Lactuca saligna]
MVRKPQISHQGVLIREVSTPVSPVSKKRRAEDVAKHLSQTKKKKKTRKLFISTKSTDEDERIPETPEFTHLVQNSTPEKTDVIPPEVSIAKSIFKEVRTSGIPAHISNTDANVDMGKGGSKHEDQGHVISTPFKTSVSVTPSTIPITSTTDSPTFEQIINQPITSIFSSQSTDTPKPPSLIQEPIEMETETDNERFGGTFEELEFHEDEEEFPDHMLMTMKQYKILNQKLNSIIQSQDDLGGGSSVLSLEIDTMIKKMESRIINKVSGMWQKKDMFFSFRMSRR